MTTSLWEPPNEVRENPGRVADSHTSFKFEYRQLGGHIHVKVRAATRHPSVQVNHSRGLCGTLVMAPEEFVLFRLALESTPTPGPTWIIDDQRRGAILCGAGHPDLATVDKRTGESVETDHAEHAFIEFEELPDGMPA